MALGALVVAAGLTDAEAAPTEQDRFERAVDLTRFRQGNYEWDTQEFVKSGFTALHEEHVQLLHELAALRAEVATLAAEVRHSTDRSRP